MRFLNKLIFHLIALLCVLIVFYYCFIAQTVSNDFLYKNEHFKNVNVSAALNNKDLIHVWCIFTKVTENAPLQMKFQNLVKSLFKFSTVPLHIHVISDNASKVIAKRVLDNARNSSRESVFYSFYDVGYCAQQISDIVQIMMPHFSSQPGMS